MSTQKLVVAHIRGNFFLSLPASVSQFGDLASSLESNRFLSWVRAGFSAVRTRFVTGQTVTRMRDADHCGNAGSVITEAM